MSGEHSIKRSLDVTLNKTLISQLLRDISCLLFYDPKISQISDVIKQKLHWLLHGRNIE